MKRRTFLTQSLALAFAGTAVVGLAGCGFRLRGIDQTTLGIDALTLVAPVSPLTDHVRRELENAGVALVDDAPLRLNLGDERIQEVSLRGGDTIDDEIELHMIAPFSVQRVSDNAYLLDQQRLEAVTTYLASDGNLLVRDDLRAEALEALRRNATRQLLDRLRALRP